MATKTIAQLTAASAAAPSNLIEMDDGSGASWKLTLDQVRQGIVQNSGNITLDNTTTAYTYAHGLGRVPIYVRFVFVCLTTDAGWACSAGTEVETCIVNGWSYLPPSYWTDSTYITFSVSEVILGNEGHWVQVIKTGTADGTPTSFHNFALKFYFF